MSRSLNRYRWEEIRDDAEREYKTTVTSIDSGLAALGDPNSVDGRRLKLTVCDESD